MVEKSISDSIREEDTLKQTMEVPQDTLKAAIKEISLDGAPEPNIRVLSVLSAGAHIAKTGQQS